MSRTYRRKNEPIPHYYLNDSVKILSENEYINYQGFQYRYIVARIPIRRDMSTREAKLDVTMYRSDKSNRAKNNWTGKALNFYVQKPYRVEVRRQLSNFKKYDDYEVVLRSRPKKGWCD